MVLRLRELDERVVPRAAASLRGVLDDATVRRARVRAQARRRWALLTAPGAEGEASGLRRLDDRMTRQGPLALLREVPQLGVLLVAVVFLAGAALAVSRSTAPDPSRAPGQGQAGGPGSEVDLGIVLGPPVGAEVEGWFAVAQARALEASSAAPDQRFLALVSLTGELTPSDAARLVGESGLDTRRAYLRAPVTGELPEVLPVEVPGDLASTLEQVYDTTARRKTQDQSDFRSLADSIEPASDEEATFKAFYEQAAEVAGEEAVAYQAGCACVFALVVEAPASALARLTALPGVRGVELAQRGASLVSLRIDPLPPSITGVRPPPAVPTGTER